jgi:hypothetical protein
MRFLKPRWVTEWIELIRSEGIKSFIKKKGWKVLIALIIFYTIRDGILYIIIPYFAITKFGGC